MTALLLLTAGPGDAADVLPALTLLGHEVTPAPPTPSAVLEHADAAAIVLDARRDLVAARTLCRLISGTLDAQPVLLVLAEGGFTAVSTTWGAAEVVVETAGPAEVEARLRLMIERTRATAADEGPERLESGELVIDASAYTAKVRGRTLDLTYKEFELLRHLAQHPGRVLSRAQLLQEVWGYDYYGGTRTVDVHIRRLRAKLGAEHDQMIGTVRNVGYRLDPRGRDAVASAGEPGAPAPSEPAAVVE
ncbi:response regulator transcription factor [Georgenia yuyongxinii]|uniref:Response regulator transcription factor n=1 Tax=Georgenia yuyongxinii TaxID=2589797 RepID=A0A5B8C6K3_9MICO|nr:response regulator transcription factor [Georgenia yuyongxinii]QDC26038.1 response regulator transcription factor [Georgenia yuyongxinii]